MLFLPFLLYFFFFFFMMNWISGIQTNLSFTVWQKVLECMNHSTELLKRGMSSDTETALEVIAEALTISSYSEKLLEMKAEALFMVWSSFYDTEKFYFEKIEIYQKSVVGFVLTSVSSGSSGGMMRWFSCVIRPLVLLKRTLPQSMLIARKPVCMVLNS